MRMPLNLSEIVAGADSDTIKSKDTLMYVTELGQAIPLYIVLSWVVTTKETSVASKVVTHMIGGYFSAPQ